MATDAWKRRLLRGPEVGYGLVVYRDGVIVSQAPDIYWLRDTDGDGVADKKEVLFTGLRKFRIRMQSSAICAGGWMADLCDARLQRREAEIGGWFETIRNFGSGVLRFQTGWQRNRNGFFKGGNTWGLDFSADNELFFTRGERNAFAAWSLPERFWRRARFGSTPSYKALRRPSKGFSVARYKDQPHVQIDNVGGFTAASGSAVYTGGAWPETITASICLRTNRQSGAFGYIEASGRLVRGEQGSEGEFIGSRDYWFRPIHQRVGPDGALYVRFL